MQYAMIVEKGEQNFSAYLPDLPGCIATGTTLEEVKQLMHEAVELHLRGMRKTDCQSLSQAWLNSSMQRSR